MGLFMGLALNGYAQPSATKPYKAYMVADAHLDTQWNWDIQTTIKHYVWNTLNQNLFLMKQYPDYIFNFEGGVKYAWMKEYYPTQYAELKPFVKSGQWHIAGSSWDAAETIVCSPESWIRNILLGQTFYRQEFGEVSDDVFLPDCFGFPYTLPTLAAHCGLVGFSSQKLQWRATPFYDNGREYPFTVGLWRGIDGSQIMMTHGFDYSQGWKDGEDLSQSAELIREAKQSPLNTLYRYYGTGDIGGSPDLKSVQAVERGLRGNGPVQIISARSNQIYHDFMPYDRHPELPTIDGEMTMDLHGNGCYTSQAAMKLYNRQNEHLGDATERAAVMADWAGGLDYPTQLMTDNWRRIILHQFHDDLTGTSIPNAYTFSWNDELLTSKRFAQTLQASVNALATRLNTNVSGEPFIVYNPENFTVNALATVDLTGGDRSFRVTDDQGRPVPSQVVTNAQGQPQLIFDASVPSVGMRVYGIKPLKRQAETIADGRTIENSVYRITVDPRGDISSIVDKRANKELVASGQALRLVVLDDCKSTSWPAWEIQKRTLDKAPVAITDGVKISKLEDGALRKTIVIEKQYGDSHIRQFIRLYEGSLADRIDFNTQVDWKSYNALLKAEFPLSVSNDKATYDLGLGTIERGNNKPTAFEVYSHEFTDLTDRSGSYGVTILNDSKYGWDKPADNVMRLSLLYSPQTSQGYRYQNRQDFGHHEFTYSLVGHGGAFNPIDANQKALALNSQLKTFHSLKHSGELGSTFSFVESSNPNVMIRAIKQAESGDGYVVRVYELSGKQPQTARLTFASAIQDAVETDGTEKTLGAATFSGHALSVDIKPFSVKTYKIHLQSKPSAQRPTAAFLPLAYDRKCFSYNEMRDYANFEGGNTYAAELMPDSIVNVDGIPFRMGPHDSFSGMSCQGNVITLPRNHRFTHLYLLASSDDKDRRASFGVGKATQEVAIPYYSGFIGQWGHEGQTAGFLKEAEVGYIGTHRHSPEADEPYVFTYLFKMRLDIPKGATQVTLPQDNHIVIFAATAADDVQGVTPATRFFRTNNISDQTDGSATGSTFGENVMPMAKVIGRSGETRQDERAELLIDGKDDTKWCDVSTAPNWVAFDLGQPQTVSGWKLLNAGQETPAYITRACLLQGRNQPNEDWVTIDMFDGNRSDIVERHFAPATVRYVRLFVTAPVQELNGNAARIYNFELYKSK